MLIEIEKPNKYVDSILLEKESGFHLYHHEGKTFMQGEGTEQEALAALEAHNPTPPSELTLAEKLASVGISMDELKAALGLGSN
jgi:hypothetical protein